MIFAPRCPDGRRPVCAVSAASSTAGQPARGASALRALRDIRDVIKEGHQHRSSQYNEAKTAYEGRLRALMNAERTETAGEQSPTGKACTRLRTSMDGGRDTRNA